MQVPGANEGFGPGLTRELNENQQQTFDGIDAKDATEDSDRGFDIIFHVDRGCFREPVIRLTRKRLMERSLFDRSNTC